MTDEEINRLVILALLLTVLGDGLALVAEWLSLRQEKKESAEAGNKDTVNAITLKEELNVLRKELARLQAQVDQLSCSQSSFLP